MSHDISTIKHPSLPLPRLRIFGAWHLSALENRRETQRREVRAGVAVGRGGSRWGICFSRSFSIIFHHFFHHFPSFLPSLSICFSRFLFLVTTRSCLWFRASAGASAATTGHERRREPCAVGARRTQGTESNIWRV